MIFNSIGRKYLIIKLVQTQLVKRLFTCTCIAQKAMAVLIYTKKNQLTTQMFKQTCTCNAHSNDKHYYTFIQTCKSQVQNGISVHFQFACATINITDVRFNMRQLDIFVRFEILYFKEDGSYFSSSKYCKEELGKKTKEIQTSLLIWPTSIFY